MFMGFEIAKKLFEISESFAHWGEQTKVMSETLGVSVEKLQQLSFAAQQSGVSTEEMGHGLAILSRRIYEAKMGSEQATETFRKAGFSLDQIKNFKSTDEALYQIADRVRGMPDQFAKLGVSQELLGRGGYQMVAMLNKGSAAMKAQGGELEKLGLVLSDNQVTALEETEHAFQRLYAVMRALGALVASEIGPVFSYLVDRFIGLYHANQDVVRVNIHEWLKGLAFVMGFLYGFVSRLVIRVIEFAKAFHMEGSILKFISQLLGVVSGLIFAKKAFDFFMFVLKMIPGLMPLINMLFTVFSTALSFLGKAALTAGGELLTFLAPFAPIIAAGTILLFLLHELFALMSGGKTWSESFAEFISSLEVVQILIKDLKTYWDDVVKSFKNIHSFGDAIKAIGSAILGLLALPFKIVFDWVMSIGKAFLTWAESLGPVKSVISFFKGMFGGGDEKKEGEKSEKGNGILDKIGQVKNGLANVEAVSAIDNPEKAVGGNSTNVGGNSSADTYNVTTNISGASVGANPQDHAKIVSGEVKKQLQQMRRETGRSVVSPVAR